MRNDDNEFPAEDGPAAGRRPSRWAEPINLQGLTDVEVFGRWADVMLELAKRAHLVRQVSFWPITPSSLSPDISGLSL